MPGYRQSLSKELEQDSNPCQPDVPSNLASTLLLQACMGHLSFASTQKLAHAAFLDGLNHPEIICLAQAGAWGQYPNHVRRDLQNQYFKHVQYAHPFPIRTSVRNTKSNEVIPMDVSCFLPHLVIESLSSYGAEHDSIFRVDLLQHFWSAIKEDDPCLLALFAETDITREDLNMTIPLLIHGDGVEYLENDSLEVQSFGPLLGSASSFDTLFLMCAYPYSCTVKQARTTSPAKVDASTWGPISKWFTWSFAAMLKGIHPSEGPDGEALQHPLLRQYAGKPFKYRYVVWSISGDHEHHSNHYKLPHWKSNKWCWNCDCSHLDKSGYDFKPCSRKWIERTVEQELESRISKHSIFKIPGVTAFNVGHDPLHVLYTHGILSHFLAPACICCCILVQGGKLCQFRKGLL